MGIESFWHWSKYLFSVVDDFGDPIEKTKTTIIVSE